MTFEYGFQKLDATAPDAKAGSFDFSASSE
jgi:hypothetical protein